MAETILAPALVARREHAEKRRRIAATIASAAFRPVFQPIVDLATGTIAGYEALTRFDDGARPDVTFGAALECGMGVELETVTLEVAMHAASHLPLGTWLSLNVSAPLLAEAEILLRMLNGWSRSVVLEITEHETIDASAPLREALVRLDPAFALPSMTPAPVSRTSTTSSSCGQAS